MYSIVEMDRITGILVDELKKMPNGTEITTCDLIRRAGLDTEAFDVGELMDISRNISLAAREEGIYLDWTRSLKLLEKLPFVLEFTVISQVA